MKAFLNGAVKHLLIILLFSMCAGISACTKKEEPRNILVFSKTAGFRHQSIEAGQQALLKLGAVHQYNIDTTEDASVFDEENLKNYHAVVFLNTTGDVLDPYQQNSFERFIQAGGGYVGIHSATDTEHDWPWYGKLSGAYFQNHPNNPNVKAGTMVVEDKAHPTTSFLPERWEVEDEFYNFRDFNEEVNTVLSIDESTYTGGTHGDFHPMSWYHEYDGGRAFYTALGHTDESYSDSLFLKHIHEGLKWVIGGDNPKPLDYSKVRTPKMPEENRFTKVVLAEGLDEPMELTVLPDNRVIYVERKGAVRLYKPETGEITTIATIPVSTKYLPKDGREREAEDGLLGITHDPGFKENGWIYFYYSPAENEPKNVLSRFEMKGDELIMDSEIIMLEVPVQREECCHTGGSLTFDSEGNLYLSTGDNTNPFASNGFSPIDERPGRSPWDAQRSSANTNDLRGKILRITPQADGSYTIPEGNLFEKETEKTKPEIYTMGHRNPYRISVDQKTGYLYWGDIGPDANDPVEGRGPEGFDEVGQAKGPGNFGWPQFIADNKAYHRYDFGAKESGEEFNEEKPINSSPNNTGLNELPPAKDAFIWYPYAASRDFPLTGSGGRSAMAGPVYYKDQFEGAERAFPEYYDGKLFIYEWMRGWIMAVTLDDNGDLVSMEPFMGNSLYSNPMDMEFAPNGDLYMLEYGTGWFQTNENARLVRIEYNGGNRKPLVAVNADKTAGALPFTVQLSSEGTIDHDNDELSYEWHVAAEGGTAQKFTEPNPSVTLAKAGVYTATLTVKDESGAEASQSIEILAGNEPPVLDFNISNSNSTFFFPGETIEYEVTVNDKEDGSLSDGGISADQVAVSIDYLPEGYDQVEIAMGHRSADASAQLAKGLKLIEGSDCKACHAIEKKSIGPSYTEVALKYKDDDDALDYLAGKVISGGSGVWGEVAMSAHPQLPEEEAKEMVRYILSLANQDKTPSLPTKGTFTTTLPEGDKGVGTYVLRASYRDNGANGINGLSSEMTHLLRSSTVQASKAEFQNDIRKFEVPNGSEIAIASASGSYLGFRQIDLTNVGEITFLVSAPKEHINSSGGIIEVRLGSPEGKVIGTSAQIEPTTTPAMSTPPQRLNVAIEQQEGNSEDLYFLFVSEDAAAGQSLFIINNIIFQSQSGATAKK